MEQTYELSDREHTPDSWGRCTCCGHRIGLLGWAGPDTVPTCPAEAVEDEAAREEEVREEEAREDREED